MKQTLTLSPGKTTSLLLKIITCLIVAGLISNYVKYVLGYEKVMGIVPMFSLSGEATIPCFFSTLILWFSAALLWFIATHQKKVGSSETLYWKGLCFVFIFLGLDELLRIHENFAGIEPYVSEHIQVFSKFMYWTVAYGFLVLAFALFFFRFYLRLPKQTKFLFAIAALLYVGGAIGMELAGAWFTRTYSMPAVSRGVFAAVEEAMEMTGVTLFIRALLHYCDAHVNASFVDLRITIGAGNQATIVQPNRPKNIKVAFKKTSG